LSLRKTSLAGDHQSVGLDAEKKKIGNQPKFGSQEISKMMRGEKLFNCVLIFAQNSETEFRSAFRRSYRSVLATRPIRSLMGVAKIITGMGSRAATARPMSVGLSMGMKDMLGDSVANFTRYDSAPRKDDTLKAI
jgi:hypothetical protein